MTHHPDCRSLWLWHKPTRWQLCWTGNPDCECRQKPTCNCDELTDETTDKES